MPPCPYAISSRQLRGNIAAAPIQRMSLTAPASKLLQPITVGPLELKNRIMFPPLTTGYEERDGSISERSLHFTSAWPVAA